jgi:hypothetical protein
VEKPHAKACGYEYGSAIRTRGLFLFLLSLTLSPSICLENLTKEKEKEERERGQAVRSRVPQRVVVEAPGSRRPAAFSFALIAYSLPLRPGFFVSELAWRSLITYPGPTP